ncbi:MAG: hypothetical protein M3007_01645 [Candidatus Eremiobacteraeota bacterium]|nr:hypothetical protein [Candidatus Eremiobacteraeota bacterium]
MKLVGALVTVKAQEKRPDYFTARHEDWIGKTGRVHAVVAGPSGDDSLVKVGFAEGTQIVFFRLADLEVHGDEPLENPRHHGKRGSHLP